MIFPCPPAEFDGGARTVDLAENLARRIAMTNGTACLHPGFAGAASVRSSPFGLPIFTDSDPFIVG